MGLGSAPGLTMSANRCGSSWRSMTVTWRSSRFALRSTSNGIFDPTGPSEDFFFQPPAVCNGAAVHAEHDVADFDSRLVRRSIRLDIRDYCSVVARQAETFRQ